MGSIARLSHVGFNVQREQFDSECEFWENVVGLAVSHRVPDQNCFFRADPLRDHEFILFAVDGPVTKFGEAGYMLGHVSFDVATDAEVDALVERLIAHGGVLESSGRGRRRSQVISPAGIRFEINTPPYTSPRPRDADAQPALSGSRAAG